ncbi:MAG: permease component of ABC-type sugar transporter [Clostridia bacterium]|jgi:raffinose/stachyose/melibiose transport system permease protein|nr:permease component of ABC-type sugar transporter [Clostridia bacterium]
MTRTIILSNKKSDINRVSDFFKNILHKQKGDIIVKTTKGDKLGITLFLIPPLALFALFFIYPVSYVFVTSFFKWDGISDAAFVAFQNYLALFKDPIFRRSVVNNVIWALTAGLIQVPLALLVALILSKKPRGWKVFRTVYFMPQVISGIALATLWSTMYNSEYGLINALLGVVGLEHLQKNWLGTTQTAFPALLIYWVFYIGYYMVIILAEITSISEEYYEAASIDGANKIQQDLYVTLPLVRNSIITCITLAMVFGLRQFEQVYLLTNGGPANKTSVMVLYLYKEMQNNNYGYANATGVMLIIVGTIVIVGVRKLFASKQYES